MICWLHKLSRVLLSAGHGEVQSPSHLHFTRLWRCSEASHSWNQRFYDETLNYCDCYHARDCWFASSRYGSSSITSNNSTVGLGMFKSQWYSIILKFHIRCQSTFQFSDATWWEMIRQFSISLDVTNRNSRRLFFPSLTYGKLFCATTYLIAYYSHANFTETVSEISGCTDIIKVLQKCNFTLMENVKSPKTFRCKSRVSSWTKFNNSLHATMAALTTFSVKQEITEKLNLLLKWHNHTSCIQQQQNTVIQTS